LTQAEYKEPVLIHKGALRMMYTCLYNVLVWLTPSLYTVHHYNMLSATMDLCPLCVATKESKDLCPLRVTKKELKDLCLLCVATKDLCHSVSLQRTYVHSLLPYAKDKRTVLYTVNNSSIATISNYG